jgi:hypothetical protein
VFFSLVLVLFGAGGVIADNLGAGIAMTAQTPLLLQLLVYVSRVTTNVQWPALIAFILTFPTGRVTPRWSWLLIVTLVLSDVLPGSFNPAVTAAASVVGFLSFIGAVGVQVYRYVRVYDHVQRQQTKWFVFIVGVAILFNVIFSGLSTVVHRKLFES